MSGKAVIGITDCEKFRNYEKWILAEGNTEVVRLGARFANLEDIKKCDGIVLTGGEDIHPRLYGMETQYAHAPSEFEDARDEFEVRTFKIAQESDLPVLGICRGLQLINCIQGGTLKQDLSDLNEVHRRVSKDDKTHDVRLEPTTMLFEIARLNQGLVNSSHHQAIDKLGKGLKVNCRAGDGTIEGIEGSGHPFLVAVQWHPERMGDQQSPLTRNIRDHFIKESKKIKNK